MNEREREREREGCLFQRHLNSKIILVKLIPVFHTVESKGSS